jgi:hypothetical protein
MGFGYGDLYNSQTDSMEKNVCDSDIDAVLDAKWDNASFDYTLFYPNYGEFREDIIAYYRGKYPAV